LSRVVAEDLPFAYNGSRIITYKTFTLMGKQAFKILVVDDDDEIRGLYTEVFRSENFEVREAKDGLEALELASQDRPDVIFTGIIMPRMDGFGLMENLRKSVVTASIPVVFSSHLGRKEDEERAKALGVRDFIVRGMTPLNEVVKRVELLLVTDEYLVDIDPRSLDAQKLARDLGINEDFLCGDGEQKFALKLRLKDRGSKTFDAELVCVA
jgi:CheY-like chemotaxis protein